VVSSHIVAEAERVLRTKRSFRPHLSDAERKGAITGIRKLARIVDPIVLPGVRFADPARLLTELDTERNQG
jgi:hypothetical protein